MWKIYVFDLNFFEKFMYPATSMRVCVEEGNNLGFTFIATESNIPAIKKLVEQANNWTLHENNNLQ